MMERYKISALMVLAMFFWAATWPIAKVLAQYISVSEVVTYRYIFSTISMAFVLKYMRLSFKISIKNLLISILAGLLLVAYTRFSFLGTKYNEAGFSAVIVTTLIPIIVYVLTALFTCKKPHFKDYIALTFCVIGVLVMIEIWAFDIGEILNFSMIYLLWAALFMALMSLVVSFVKHANPIVFGFYIYLFTILIDYFIFFENTSGSIFLMNWLFWINFLILVIFSTTFATTIYFIGVQKLGPHKASVFNFLVPFFAIILSNIFLAEDLKLSTIIGVCIAISGLIIINKKI